MECKLLNIDCVTRVINKTWEEERGCECGVSCSYQDRSNGSSESVNGILTLA